jgi:hypothetical protein
MVDEENGDWRTLNELLLSLPKDLADELSKELWYYDPSNLTLTRRPAPPHQPVAPLTRISRRRTADVSVASPPVLG